MRDQVLVLGRAAAQLAGAFLDLAARARSQSPARLHPPAPGHALHLGPVGRGLRRRPARGAGGPARPVAAAGPLPPGRGGGLRRAPAHRPGEHARELLGFSKVQRSPIDVHEQPRPPRAGDARLGWPRVAGTLEKALWDLSLYSTEEFGFVRLPDAFTTGSSIMPQKRNPDVVELARARCRELRGLQGLLGHLAGGLPSSYHRDCQFLKKPFLEALTKGKELLEVCTHLLPGLQIQERGLPQRLHGRPVRRPGGLSPGGRAGPALPGRLQGRGRPDPGRHLQAGSVLAGPSHVGSPYRWSWTPPGRPWLAYRTGSPRAATTCADNRTAVRLDVNGMRPPKRQEHPARTEPFAVLGVLAVRLFV